MNFSRPDFASQNKQATTNSGTGLSKQDIRQPRLRVITGVDNFPTPSVQSTTLPIRENFNHPDNRYRESRSVDSRSQAKSSSKAVTDQGLPQYFGSTFTHVPNAPNRPLLIPPKSPAYAAPYSPLAKRDFATSPLQNQRSADGSIIGSPSKRFVQEHVSLRLQISLSYCIYITCSGSFLLTHLPSPTMHSPARALLVAR